MEDIRRMEEETQKELEEVCVHSHTFTHYTFVLNQESNHNLGREALVSVKHVVCVLAR